MAKQKGIKYGICSLCLVPCRIEPSDKSEMINQLLFGDTFQILEERKNWIRIRNTHDNYESWIDAKQFFGLDEKEFIFIEKAKIKHLNADLVAVLASLEDSNLQTIVFGSSLPQLNDNVLALSGRNYQFNGLTTQIQKGRSRSYLIETAMLYLNVPYLWGGRSPFGIDCSGFTQMVYKFFGLNLPRDAYQQAEIGQTLSFIEESEPGDLAFFDNQDGHIIHVGILLENNNIIHASGKVRIDKIDHQGIYNKENRSYSHKLRLIKSLL